MKVPSFVIAQTGKNRQRNVFHIQSRACYHPSIRKIHLRGSARFQSHPYSTVFQLNMFYNLAHLDQRILEFLQLVPHMVH